MASISELFDALHGALTGDNLVSAAVSTAISPEGKALVVSFLNGVEQLEAHLESKHQADKAAAVEQAKAEATAAAQPAEPQQ